MEFVQGLKIDELDELDREFGSAKNVTDLLIDIYARMIFVHGHIHCDSHPGNIMIRKRPNGKPEVVLIDHGFYCTTGEKFRQEFCELWYSLASMDYANTEKIAREMGIGDYFRYLPLLFTMRTIKARKPLGAKLTEDEK